MGTLADAKSINRHQGKRWDRIAPTAYDEASAEYIRAELAKPENAVVRRMVEALIGLERIEAAEYKLRRRDDPTLSDPATWTPRERSLHKRLIRSRAAARLERDYGSLLRAA